VRIQEENSLGFQQVSLHLKLICKQGCNETGRSIKVPQDVSQSWGSTLELILKNVLSGIYKDDKN
jgi:hypothetical protein